jgi:TonB-linked SusC/RagA family outer membrane protein
MTKQLSGLIRILFCLVCILIGVEFSYGQAGSISITGVVVDETGKPLPGASVSVKGTKIATLSDAQGAFTLRVNNSKDVLLVSYLSYAEQEIVVEKNTNIRVTMSKTSQSLNSVVVIGYGSQSKRKVTGAIGSVSASDITEVPVTGLDQALSGRLAGVQVTQNSGAPGGSVSVRIRGIGSFNAGNEPLYVVDGIPLSVNINSINPNDIERIDVLKDAASSAIYGSRASNGVVLVTTKRGKLGKTVVNFDAFYGTQSAAKKIDLMNGPEFAKLANQNLAAAGVATNPAWANPSTVPSYDWQDGIFETSPIQSYNVSISSGSERSRNFFSLGYFNQAGIIVGSDYERFSARWNTEYEISSRVKVGGNLNMAYEDRGTDPTSGAFGNPILTAWQQAPTNPILASQEGIIDDIYYGWQGYAFPRNTTNINHYPSGISNVVHTYEKYLDNKRTNLQIMSSVFADIEIIKDLKFRTSFNYSRDNGFGTSSIPGAPSPILGMGVYQQPNSRYGELWSSSDQWNWVNTLSYSKSIGEHNFSLVAGTDALKSTIRGVNVNVINVPMDQLSIDASQVAGRVVTGSPIESSLVSYVGRLTYDFAGKYLLTANIRRDGSSKFGPGNAYGYFPSASVGWRISEEKFMKSVSFINDLKLRGSYGVVGNQNIGNFKFLNTYSNSGGFFGYTINNAFRPGLFPNNVGDPNIRWEKSIQTNIGLDAALLNNKVTFTADYYIKTQEDLLGAIPVPAFTGIFGSSVFRNGFSMENRGIELSLGYHDKIGELNFSINGNFSTLRNKVTQLSGSAGSSIIQSISPSATSTYNDGNSQTRTYVGQTVGQFWGYVTDGIFQNDAEVAASGMAGVKPGDRRYKDLNKDGKINDLDRTSLGHGLPGYTYGFSMNLEYKGFDLSALFTGQGDAKIANTNKFYYYNMRYFNATGVVNGSKDLVNSWSGPGTSNTLPRQDYNAPTSNRFFSDFNIENGAFLRMRNLQIGYTLPGKVAEKARMSKARVYVSAQNLFTISSYSGYDPDLGSANINGATAQSPLTIGVDFGRYPVARMFTFGISTQF